MICTVVGTRPNFIKMTPIINELNRRNIPQIFIHTGQHYDAKMSEIFFEQLGMPQPDIYLGVGSGTHAEQTAKIMTSFEKVCMEHQPQLVIVPGDVNSTLACALVASKLHIPVAHVESGLRSFDRGMPEEINRVVVDHIAELLFTTEPSGNDNLATEGIDASNVHYVGNSMIDTLRTHQSKAESLKTWETYGYQAGEYGLITLHRPSNVDSAETVQELIKGLSVVGEKMPLLFPMHPRTRAKHGDLWATVPNIQIIDPLGYLEFLSLMSQARLVMTDSGGIQEETTALGVPCMTLRNNTERPVTLTEGTNRLVAPKADDLITAFNAIIADTDTSGKIPHLWDGQAAPRIVDIVEQWSNA